MGHFEGPTKDPGKRRNLLGVLPIILLVALSLLLLVPFAIPSNEWYVADPRSPVMGASTVTRTVHYGLADQVTEWRGEDTSFTSHKGYDGDLEERYTYPGVAQNVLYILIAVILTACWYVYVAVQYENGLSVGNGRWSYMVPSVVGIVTVVSFGIGLLYFYVAFEAALRDDFVPNSIDDEAGVGSAFWIALVSMLVMLLAVAISFSGNWRAMKKAQGEGEVQG